MKKLIKNQDDAVKEAAQYFETKPELEAIFLTEDAQAFENFNLAYDHGKQIKAEILVFKVENKPAEKNETGLPPAVEEIEVPPAVEEIEVPPVVEEIAVVPAVEEITVVPAVEEAKVEAEAEAKAPEKQKKK